MRVLLIESQAEDTVFLRDVLTEIGEGRWNNWVNIEVLEATSWTDAAAILASEPVDVVLLSLDTHGIETFRRAQQLAQPIPIILVKKQVDCAPLAHAMRNAIERHHLLTASRAASTYDTLTGLLNRAGFLTCADRDRKLAERLDRRLLVLVAEIPVTDDEQCRDLVLVETADHLRAVAGPADILARIEPTRLAITIFDTEAESIEAAHARINAALRPHRIRTGAAIFSPDRPTTLDGLLEQAGTNLSPNVLAMRT
jgi:GGDEF domain-containing protein